MSLSTPLSISKDSPLRLLCDSSHNNVPLTLNARYECDGGGSGSQMVNQPYQKIVGTLTAGTHPGGLNGQDAYNDFLIPMGQGAKYIVRRLIPAECAKLQGFPSEWGKLQPKDTLSDEEYLFWIAVRKTYAELNGKTVKQYTKAQMLDWYGKLHSDGAEYKMWGNGVALPCVSFVLSGIVAAERRR